ncbi:MAG: tRNA (adenosine(37)-N6)-threonylcarbamoyltransferase complex transferase subunit TsaD [Bacteroidota bacterium]
MNILGIETSCDETSVAIISDGQLKINLIFSQEFHKEFGGVVPELSSRAHLQLLMPLIKKALNQSFLSLNQIDLIAATAGPGLIGALLVGLTFAKSLAFSLNRPFIPVNHIEGHVFSGFLMEQKPEFPYLCLVVSGGHTLLLIVKSDTEIEQLGTTIDDAAGEAFDKVAKLLGLGYPGGPKIQSAAEGLKSDSINFPIAHCKSEFDFSFSGLKTSVLRYIQKNFGSSEKIPPENLRMIAFSFQQAVIKALVTNVKKAVEKFHFNSISLVGGVAANKLLGIELEAIAKKFNKKLVIPSSQFCSDNAAMIAYRGLILHNAGFKYNLEYNAYPSISDNTFIKPFIQ